MLKAKLGSKSYECFKKKIIGKPCEGKLHARFDEGEQETGRLSATALALYSTVQKIKFYFPIVKKTKRKRHLLIMESL